ncbi:ribosome biogenesis GTPase [Paenibacillus cellulosilyticus]|uniref:Small ribosomal subunit biogenesis GTPase RsgA n=1 Tax=Paenibacillus cellulosilyticus TaxID=375489 RepID=A0A2V2YPG0_9BACL|nr:ribosome small subunit-dependent GTPase A [Paenibacillus cellulosilyticus]PWV97919.1 ribosome biogenesis GTPase [Paenibacillus cellulosilyticus]QKS44042.1 ribosome small subunit-dependent GTPase A [Paenibacillus cellulosilyticus]
MDHNTPNQAFNTTHLQAYGWNEHWEAQAQAVNAANNTHRTLVPARITAQFSHVYRVITNEGERLGTVAGRYQYEASGKGDYPAVGDWVMAELAPGDERVVIHALLPRKSAVSRKVAGSQPEEQVIGANIDFILLVNALNQDFNLRRIERYLTAAMGSGAQPVIVLTKADLCADPESMAEQTRAFIPDSVPVVVVSAARGEGRERLAPYLGQGMTVAVAGSSGAGKSTLLNWLSEADRMRVQDIREDDAKGRHTTTHRELFPIEGGALLMDTPGMRELQLWHADEGHEEAFSDIAALASQCRFRDCRHEREEGCAVLAALDSGELDRRRYNNYVKTGKEIAHQARKERIDQRSKERRSGTTAGRPRPTAKQMRSWEEE